MYIRYPITKETVDPLVASVRVEGFISHDWGPSRSNLKTTTCSPLFDELAWLPV